MEFNLLIVGVGGQGILTIAQAISHAAMRRGYHVKQSEVHGMSQRGGAVQAHLRFADHPISSDLIPLGEADLLLAVEPLEALRYTEYLNEHSVVVASGVPFENIPNYPSVEEVLDRVSRFGGHVVINAQKLATAAGSVRAENMVILGAATLFMDFTEAEIGKLVEDLFSAKGERVVQVNRRALRIGRRAATLFREGLREGYSSAEVRKWMDSLPPDRLAGLGERDELELDLAAPLPGLTADAENAIGNLLQSALTDGRRQLLEHEVYRIVEKAGAITPPVHRFIPVDATLEDADLDDFSSERVVLKIVSPDIVHKTESGSVAFVQNAPDTVRQHMRQMIQKESIAGHRICGVLAVEFVDETRRGLGGELFVGIRQSREFGPVIAAGLGGVDTEYLAAKMRPGIAVAKASAIDTSPEEFFELFRRTAAYEILAGKVRGHDRIVGDGDLIRCFRAFIGIARRFCVGTATDLCIEELEVNPFAFRRRQMTPLDGRGRLGEPIETGSDRPVGAVARMLEPASIAVTGVSATRSNFGRIILNNIKDCGFPHEHLYVIKKDTEKVDGIPCYPSVRDVPEHVDLVVTATSAHSAVELVHDVLPDDGRETPCTSMILIPGAMGEKEGTEATLEGLRAAIESARRRDPDAPVFLGGNCMGVRSRPGCYDTFFIPASKLDPRRHVPARRCAIVSQSGAFLITRMSNLQFLDPALAVSVGNQVDLTVSDVVTAIADRNDINCIGVYVEGFNDLDGLAFLRAVEKTVQSGKVLVFYKAGRTEAGRSAARGHTASVAGDYDVCQSAVAAAGAIVCDTFKEFEQLVELATDLHGKIVGGRRIAAVTNAGYEAVGMADTVRGARYALEMPELDDDTMRKLEDTLAKHGVAKLVDAKNPLDLTPMAGDAAYEDAVQIMLNADNIDAVVVGCVPMTPALLSTPDEITQTDSIAQRMQRVFKEAKKPMVFAVDCTGPYDALASAVREAGIPVFRSADQAIRSLGRYLGHRSAPAFTESVSRGKEQRTQSGASGQTQELAAAN